MIKNKFYTITLKKKKDFFRGVFIREGKEWILMNQCYTDYMLDGFCIVRKDKIESIERKKHEKFIEEVLIVNHKIKDHTIEGLPLTDSTSLFNWIKNNDIPAEIYIDNKTTFNIGKVYDVRDGSIFLGLLSPEGIWLNDKRELKISTIERICWNTDYTNSLYKYSLASDNDVFGRCDLFSISIKGWKDKIYGIAEDDENDWIILNSLFADFMLDGIKAVNRKHVESIGKTDREIFKEKVLNVNGRLVNLDKRNFPPLNTNSLFTWLKDNNILVGLYMRNQTAMSVGIIDSVIEKSFYLKELTPQGKWEKEGRLFRIDSVRAIDWGTDYLNSLSTYSSSIKI